MRAIGSIWRARRGASWLWPSNSLTSIDDIIARGKRRDWSELRQTALADRSLFE